MRGLCAGIALIFAGLAQAVEVKPEINGTYESGCRVLGGGGTCEYKNGSAVPTGGWTGNGLITTGGATGYITIRDLSLKDSAGPGMKIYGRDDGAAVEYYILNNTILRTVHDAIWGNQLEEGDTFIVKDNDVTLSALSGVDDLESNWGACIAVDSGFDAVETVYALFENNTVDQCGGEGMTFLRANGGIMRHNTVSNAQRLTYYFDNASNSIAEHNIGAGEGIDGSAGSHGGVNWFGSALVLGTETYTASARGSSTGNIIRNNLYANTQTGPFIWCQTSTACTTLQLGGYFYGNTILQNNNSAIGQLNLTAFALTTTEFKNNLFVGNSTCQLPSDGDTTFSNNLYEGTPSSNCQGSGDVYSGDDGITYDYTLAKSGAIPTEANFTPSNGSDGDDAGTALTSTLFTASDYPQRTEFDTCILSDANWAKGLYVDYGCNVRGASPDIGGVEH